MWFSTSAAKPPLLLLCYFHRSTGIFPVLMHGATAARLVKGNGKVLHRRCSLRNLHVHSGEFVAFVLIGDAPFACFLVDDQRPFVGARDGEDGVAADGHIFSADG